MLAGQRQLLRRGGAGDHARAHQLADLDRRKPHAARRAEHGQRLAGLQPRAVRQPVQRRAVGDGQPGRRFVRQRLGHADQLVDRHGEPGAARAPADIGGHPRAEPRPGPRPRPAPRRARRTPPPARTAARGLNWYLFSMISVSKKFSAATGDVDDDLAGPRDRIGQILDRQALGRTEGPAQDGAHRGSSLTLDRSSGRHLRRARRGLARLHHALGLELTPQSREGEPDPGLHRAQRQIDLLGDLAVRQPVDRRPGARG